MAGGLSFPLAEVVELLLLLLVVVAPVVTVAVTVQ